MQESPEQTLANAKRSLMTQREGGTHRPGPSIGKGSAELKAKHWKQRVKRILIALAAIWIGTSAFGLFVDAIGVVGLMLAVVLAAVAVGVLWKFPQVKVPKRAELTLGNPKQMVARTELWLEAQRPALPAPAVKIIDQLGVQLDALGLQLETIDANHPAAAEVRELVGEYIPETIENYRKIPAHMRGETHAGKTADQRLTDSLTKLSGEVDRVTRRLAEGALDDLAIKDRYLEYRYGGDEMLADLTREEQGSGVQLPDFTADTSKDER